MTMIPSVHVRLSGSRVGVRRWPLMGGVGAGARGAALGVLAERRAQLLQLSLEAATCAQRDRFAEQPARAVAAAAAAAAQAADYIVQVCQPKNCR